MSAAPRTTYQGGHTPHTHSPSDLERFLTCIYTGQAGGWCEVCYISGDPDNRDDPENRARRAEWLQFDPKRLQSLVSLITALAKRYGDVYVSRTCYTRPKRDKALALPSRALVVDDAPADGDYTFSIQTSKHKRHGWCILDRTLDATAISDLSQRAAYALGGDTGGWDVTQLVRVPGTYNTKGGGCWEVQYQGNNRRTYTPDELGQRYPAINKHRMGKRGELATDGELESFWRGNLRALLAADGIPRRLSDKSAGRRILTEGTPSDRSGARFAVIDSLIRHGYPDEEIIVLTEELCDWEHSTRKGTAWLDTDIRTCIARSRERHPTVTVTPSRLHCLPKEPAPRITKAPERRGRGRPAGIDANTYYTELHQLAQIGGDGDEMIVLMTVGELADRLLICRRKAATLEAQLRTEGRIGERRRTNKNHSSYLVLTPQHAVLGHAKNTSDGMQKIGAAEPTPIAVYSIPTPQSEPSPALPLEGHTPVAAPPPAPPPVGAPGGVSSPPAPAPSLTEMVTEALDAQPGLHWRHMPTKVQQVAAYIESNYDRVVRPEVLTRLILQAQRRQTWERDRAKLADMLTDDLYTEQRKRERRHVRASLEGTDKQVYAIGYQLQHVNDELTRRGLPLEQPRRKRRKKAQAQPAATPAMQHYIDLATPEPEPIAPPPPPSCNVAGLVQRLKARIQQEAGTA